MLTDLHCTHGAPALGSDELASLLAQVPDWRLAGPRIERTYAFKDYHETIAFVNALAWMVHREDHHPELTVRYRHCVVAYTTHSAGNAVSLNDFICAAKADALYEGRTRA
ncbi:4a-hydroxytetrahydrobiopterin dehydratase [Massilia sp. Dwa41.01b]|nr:4a-hydroxytetrahydrobiopterin dehydratase [Massilia sp. Dwa41.01b]QNB01399.1 4a-hydroxytetrahydrobiopterin dehydratase [Massilia sp. Se16.2.3]